MLTVCRTLAALLLVICLHGLATDVQAPTVDEGLADDAIRIALLRMAELVGQDERPDHLSADAVVAIALTRLAELVADRPEATATATATEARDVAGGRRPAYAPGDLTPNQLTDGVFLTYEEAYAACGPAAAVALARALGRDPALDEVVDLAREVGWTAWLGMAGPRGQVDLLTRMGIAARLVGEEDEIDWRQVAEDVLDGVPVIVMAPGHYYVAERFDPESGKFDLANSATVLRAAEGRRWFAPEEIATLGFGPPTITIHLDRTEPRPARPDADVLAAEADLRALSAR